MPLDLHFAPGYPRDEDGLILFPRDTSFRRQVQPEEVMKHPAKLNCFIMLEIFQAFTKPGDHVIDIFGGSGTTALGALMGRHVTLIDIEEFFYKSQRKMLEETWADPDFDAPLIHPYFLPREEWGNVVTILSDNIRALPIPCDHMYFSPPYANDLAHQGGGALTEEIQESADLYTAHPQNLGRQPEFPYRQMMDRLYKKVGESVKPGGTVTITHRDRARGGNRILLANSVIKSMTNNGFKLYHWERWKAPGSLAARVNEQRGALVINDEDILTFQKL